jgi:hypothetical protein
LGRVEKYYRGLVSSEWIIKDLKWSSYFGKISGFISCQCHMKNLGKNDVTYLNTITWISIHFMNIRGTLRKEKKLWTQYRTKHQAEILPVMFSFKNSCLVIHLVP